MCIAAPSSSLFHSFFPFYSFCIPRLSPRSFDFITKVFLDMLCQVCPLKLHTSVFLRSGRLLVTQESLLWLSCWASCSCCGRAWRGTKAILNPCRLLARMLCDMAIGTRLNSSFTLKRTACRARLSLMVAFRRRLSVCLFFSTWPQWDQEGLARFGCLETSAHHVPCP